MRVVNRLNVFGRHVRSQSARQLPWLSGLAKREWFKKVELTVTRHCFCGMYTTRPDGGAADCTLTCSLTQFACVARAEGPGGGSRKVSAGDDGAIAWNRSVGCTGFTK